MSPRGSRIACTIYLGHVSRVGSVLYRSCTTYHNGRRSNLVRTYYVSSSPHRSAHVVTAIVVTAIVVTAIVLNGKKLTKIL